MSPMSKEVTEVNICHVPTVDSCCRKRYASSNIELSLNIIIAQAIRNYIGK